ncbi:hypothetical protein [Sulfurospirillum barnesii]|uniref:Uncharacterized protein n=1 Tax=Sulfurospirillum barnesii (strain ATCC 700032 / DSM 10660 / SES-3) TaxID=760154 RepID=I3XWJ5_SULBS|nr:hypothetical protein [Sulfurospirillum barnesii]AFL68319.1 hypothetical protein Sulba_1020 [Sulfurospirillum barnesii SES-3]
MKIILFLVMFVFATSPINAYAGVDFEWRLSLNNRYHADPYGYRYALSDRFRIKESNVVFVLDSVGEPSDAYLIFRFSELCGKSYEHVLRVYRKNPHAPWREIALLLGIDVKSNAYISLGHQHDLRDEYRNDRRRYERYEDRGVIIKREEIYIPQTYQEQQRRYPEHRHDRYLNEDDRYEERRGR